MMEYFCSKNALEFMRTVTPADLADYLDSYDAPSGHVIITNEADTTYILKKDDLNPNSRIIKYEDYYMSVEYFENGIPSWLLPIPGIRIYLAEWTGSSWEFTKVSGI